MFTTNFTSFFKIIGAIIILTLILLELNKVQSIFNHNDNVNKPVVVSNNQVVQKVDKDLGSFIPVGNTAIGEIKDNSITTDPSKIVEVTHIIYKDNKTNQIKQTQINTTKVFRGLTFEPKFYLGYTNTSFTLGLDLSFFRYSKYTLDGLVSFPYLGLGLAYELTDNTFIGLAGDYKYIGYKDIKDISSYNTGEGGVYPLLYAGFKF